MASRKEIIGKLRYRKFIVCAVIVLTVIFGILALGKYHDKRKYNENDFGAYFRFDNFQLTMEEVIAREKELYNEITYQEIEVPQVGKSLKFPDFPEDNEECRIYQFHPEHLRLIQMKAYARQNYIETFSSEFGVPHEGRYGVVYWYGHIGSDKAILMAYQTQLSMEMYEIHIITEDYIFPLELQ